MRTISIETRTHGRALIKDPVISSSTSRLLVGFHGYGQNAEEMAAELDRIPGSEQWTLVSVQALNRFYARGDRDIVASWMTRQDREFAIADNIAYVDRVVATLLSGAPDSRIVFAGFSQGVAMAYRAAVLGAHRAQGLIAVGGDVPPDVKDAPASRFPELLIAVGERDQFYTPPKVAADEALLKAIGVQPDIFRYRGGHEWTDELRQRIHFAIAAWA
jgi:predicted esterase